MHRSTQKVTESVPGRKVVWHISDAYLAFTEDKTEWTGTEITFDIVPRGNATEVRFTHVGLVPEFQCYGSCSNAWNLLITTNLRNLMSVGGGVRNQKDEEAQGVRL